MSRNCRGIHATVDGEAPPVDRPPGLSYARARLLTGITGVGTWVLVAATLLLLDVPTRVLGGVGGRWPVDVAVLLAVLGTAALAALPFDVVGGLVLPRRFGRPAPSLQRFARAWLRGVGTLAALSALSGSVLLVAGRAGGRPAALAAFAALAVALLWGQEPLARLVGGLRRVPSTAFDLPGIDLRRIVFLDGGDPGFSGGLAGPSGALVLPAHWTRTLPPGALGLLVERRRRIVRSGAWRRTQALAVAWNLAGFALASLLPGAGVTSVAELVTTALGFTLWTFGGLLLLPTPSRRATFAADAATVVDDVSRARLIDAFEGIDRLQDDEPERSVRVESVFHPVPSVARRVRAMFAAPAERSGGVWHLARTALYLAHVGLTPLPRAVHCNAGRPELWVYLPTDG